MTERPALLFLVAWYTDEIGLSFKKLSSIMTATVLTAWRDDEVIAAVMGVAFFSAWKPIFDTFVKEWKVREKGTQ